jgi:cytochrome b
VTLLQAFGINPLGELVVMLVVPLVVVAFGTYVGVLMALQSFFGESSWEDVSPSGEE